MKLINDSLHVLSAIVALSLVAPATAAPISSSDTEPALRGDSAIQYLKSTGQHDSLAKAFAAAQYSFQPQEHSSGQISSRNIQHDFDSDIGSTGFNLSMPSPQAGMLETRWKLESIGYGDLRQTVSAGEVSHDSQRAEIVRNDLGITEWFVNKPDGLEHGFTLSQRPTGFENESNLPLSLRLDVSGNIGVRAAKNGQAVELVDPENSNVILTYDRLKVWDADQQPLSARMKTDGEKITFEVDDENARYPITIDPTFAQQAYLKASNTE